MKLLLYSFRTFPHKKLLEQNNVFVFGKLKQDLEVFKKIIISKHPNLILGIAHKQSGKSQFEIKAINQFQSDKQIIKGGVAEYLLDVPEVIPQGFILAREPTTSFCNWTMYSIAHFLETNSPLTKLTFTHVHRVDLPALVQWIQQVNQNS